MAKVELKQPVVKEISAAMFSRIQSSANSSARLVSLIRFIRTP